MNKTRRAFSMMESLIAISITTVAGAALLASLSGAVASSTEVTYVTIARGLADQLMLEIESARFPDGTTSTSSSSFSTSTGYTYVAGEGNQRVTRHRRDFVTIDDYADWVSQPPVTRDGYLIGTDGQRIGSYNFRFGEMQPDPEFLNNFTRRVFVERIEANADGTWTTTSSHTDYRRVTVNVDYTDGLNNTRTLIRNQRIFSYVAPAFE